MIQTPAKIFKDFVSRLGEEEAGSERAHFVREHYAGLPEFQTWADAILKMTEQDEGPHTEVRFWQTALVRSACRRAKRLEKERLKREEQAQMQDTPGFGAF